MSRLDLLKEEPLKKERVIKTLERKYNVKRRKEGNKYCNRSVTKNVSKIADINLYENRIDWLLIKEVVSK